MTNAPRARTINITGSENTAANVTAAPLEHPSPPDPDLHVMDGSKPRPHQTRNAIHAATTPMPQTRCGETTRDLSDSLPSTLRRYLCHMQAGRRSVYPPTHTPISSVDRPTWALRFGASQHPTTLPAPANLRSRPWVGSSAPPSPPRFWSPRPARRTATLREHTDTRWNISATSPCVGRPQQVTQTQTRSTSYERTSDAPTNSFLLVMTGVEMPPDETLVWVVQITGDFPCNYCSRSETVLTSIFTVEGERRIFGTLESTAFPLRKLGRVADIT